MHNQKSAKLVEIDLTIESSPSPISTRAEVVDLSMLEEQSPPVSMLTDLPNLIRKKSLYEEEEKRSKSTAPVNAALT